jgi:hypothetical protein
MEDLRTLARIAWKRKWLLLVLGFVSVVALWLFDGGRLTYIVVSPDQTYRLEFYDPPRYHDLLDETMESPGFVRLRRNTEPYDLIGESPVVDFFSNGEVFWSQGRTGDVLVGTAVRFRNVHPMTPGGDILPLPHQNP